MPRSDLPAVHFIPARCTRWKQFSQLRIASVSAGNSKGCQLSWEMPANQWRPLLPYPPFSVCSQVLAVLTGFCGIKYTPSLPHPRKAKLSASSWRPLPSQQFASHQSYVRVGIFPSFASRFHLTVFKIVQTHLFPLWRAPGRDISWLVAWIEV